MWWPAVAAFCLASAAAAAPRQTVCRYESCPRGDPGMLNVHLVPHSHDDVGWLKTVDQYFYGAKSSIQRAGVQYILDSVVKELLKDPARRFIYVETAFFWRWFLEQDQDTIDTVKRLVNEGRLEFTGGGWSMNDEACVHYNAMIDQMSLGMRVLSEHFGQCGIPRVAWQIDPFGHTKEQANLFAAMGFDGLFFARLDYDDKNRRINDTEMELVWQASHNQDDSGDLFTSVLFNHYHAPPGHCYDVTCNDQPIMDDIRLKDYNVDLKVDDIIKFARNESRAFRTNHIAMTMGQDFTYQDANMWYKNLDKLIKYVNARQAEGETVNLFYSTPSCYLKALNEAGEIWPTKQDDFVPYASDPWAYWSGYFTSRPAQKGYIRQSNNFLQICKQLTALLQTERTFQTPNRVDLLRYAMGVNQHHDAVTGTEKQHVADDYGLRLSQATEACQQAVSEAISRTGAERQSFCTQLNTSACHVTEENGRFVSYVYNPLGRAVSHWVRLPVTQQHYLVLDPAGDTVPSQLVEIPLEVQNLPGRRSNATHELVFKAADLPPLGFRAYFISAMSTGGTAHSSSMRPGLKTLTNGRLKVDLDPGSLRLGRVTAPGLDVNLNQTFMWYEGYGDPSNPPWNAQQRPSGAYAFHPKGEAKPIEPKSVETLDGPLVKEYRHSFGLDWVHQVTRLYTGEHYLEVAWQVGPIPTDDGIAKEVISRFTTSINSGDVFYTDSNGRQMMKRRRDHRDTWSLNVTEPVAGNYYPVNSRLYIRDAAAQLTVLNDRSQGGSSLASGQLEFMLHRRTVQDDGFGVGEPLNETEFGRGLVVRGRHWVLVSPPDQAARLHRDLAERVSLAPQVTFVPAQHMTRQQWISDTVVKQFVGMNPLPENVHLLTLEMYKPDKLLLRLEHQYQTDEHPQLSQPVTVSLQGLFTTLNLTSVEEYGLSADRPLGEIQRLHWDHRASNLLPPQPVVPQAAPSHTDPFTVHLSPMQIRTFVATYTSEYPLPTPPDPQ